MIELSFSYCDNLLRLVYAATNQRDRTLSKTKCLVVRKTSVEGAEIAIPPIRLKATYQILCEAPVCLSLDDRGLRFQGDI